jgi:hypothetical protein
MITEDFGAKQCNEMITGMMNESGGLVCWPVQYLPFFNIFLFGFLSDDFKFLFETINLFFNLFCLVWIFMYGVAPLYLRYSRPDTNMDRHAPQQRMTIDLPFSVLLPFVALWL